jgi:16S rRNA (guanine527-N7)-methyltransferase
VVRLVEALAAEPAPPTTVTDPADALDRHVADSLSGLIVPAVRAARTLGDIGAGAGFPGLPLAIALPEARVDLIEATRRKCDVIARLAGATGSRNARPVPTRAESWAAAEGRGSYEVVTARAVAPLAVLVEYAAPLLAAGGSFVAWKGARETAEEEAGAHAASIVGLRPAEILPVRPFEAVKARHLHVYVKDRPTPARFPRRPGIAAKRPLAG